MRGLRNAEEKGFAAGEDLQFSERDCPYVRYEHKRCWLEGFRRARTNGDKSDA